jgi:hypothetical protein
MRLNESCNKYHVSPHLFDTFPIQDILEELLLQLFWNSDLEYATRNLKDIQRRLRLQGTYQFIIYANGVNLFGIK